MPIDPTRDRTRRAPVPLAAADAETLALRAVGWLAGNEAAFLRFAALTGMSVEAIRAALPDPAVLGAVLDFVLADEPLLLAFAAEAGVAPDLPARARRLLPGAAVE